MVLQVGNAEAATSEAANAESLEIPETSDVSPTLEEEEDDLAEEEEESGDASAFSNLTMQPSAQRSYVGSNRRMLEFNENQRALYTL